MWLLEDPEDVLHFDDKTLISNYRLLRNMILQLAHVLQPQPAQPLVLSLRAASKKQQKHHVVVPYVFFSLQKAIFKVK